MLIQGHDANYSFDYKSFVNAVFDVVSTRPDFKSFYQYQWGITPNVMGKFFCYKKVSLPTLLQIEVGSGVRMIDHVVKIN